MPTAGERRKMRDVSGRRVQAADLASKRRPAIMDSDTARADALLRVHQARAVSLPEPVDGLWIGWRKTTWWEEELVRSARLRERRRELAMFAGLIG